MMGSGKMVNNMELAKLSTQMENSKQVNGWKERKYNEIN